MRLELTQPLSLAARKLLLQQLAGNTGPSNLHNAGVQSAHTVYDKRAV